MRVCSRERERERPHARWVENGAGVIIYIIIYNIISFSFSYIKIDERYKVERGLGENREIKGDYGRRRLRESRDKPVSDFLFATLGLRLVTAQQLQEFFIFFCF